MKRTYRIGRRRDADIVIADRSVSRSHADLTVDESGALFLCDRGSRLGTFTLCEGTWHPVRQAFVAPDQPILLGDHETTARALLDGLGAAPSRRANTEMLLPGARRKLVAILAADVVGYSKMMARDEAGTLARLRDCLGAAVEPAVAAEDGRIFKTMGDGFLAEFAGCPAAMRCAAAIQGAVARRNAAAAPDRRLRFRIGLNVGRVIADGDDLFGDGVNLAARLEALAAPGGICLSAAVYEAVRDAVDCAYEDWGPREVKNFPAPVHAYHVDAASLLVR